MKSEQLTASIWGAGGIAQVHAKTLSALGIKVKVVYDINKKNADFVASLCNAEISTTDEEELLNHRVDVVHLCTPANLHYEQLNKLIDFGVNIFCEKPLTLNEEEAKTLAKRVVDNKIISGVGFNVRYHENMIKAKEIIHKYNFGPIRFVHGRYLQEYHTFPAPLDWRYNSKLAGKMRAVTEIGSHWFDLIQYLTNSKITKVSATFSKFSPERKLKDGFMYALEAEGEKIEIESEDAAVITLQFEDGFIGSCVLSEASPGRVNHLSVEITGENQNIWWNSEEVNVLHMGVKNEGVNSFLQPFGGGFSDTHKKMFSDFYADVSEGYRDSPKNYPTIEDGAYNVMISNAVYESATNNSVWVDIRQ